MRKARKLTDTRRKEYRDSKRRGRRQAERGRQRREGEGQAGKQKERWVFEKARPKIKREEQEEERASDSHHTAKGPQSRGGQRRRQSPEHLPLSLTRGPQTRPPLRAPRALGYQVISHPRGLRAPSPAQIPRQPLGLGGWSRRDEGEWQGHPQQESTTPSLVRRAPLHRPPRVPAESQRTGRAGKQVMTGLLPPFLSGAGSSRTSLWG